MLTVHGSVGTSSSLVFLHAGKATNVLLLLSILIVAVVVVVLRRTIVSKVSLLAGYYQYLVRTVRWIISCENAKTYFCMEYFAAETGLRSGSPLLFTVHVFTGTSRLLLATVISS